MANKDSGFRFIGKETGCYCHIVGNKGFRNRDLSMLCRMTIVLLGIGVLAGASILAGCCSCADPSDPGKGQSMPQQTIEQVQEEHTDEWMAIPGVQGTAIGMSEGKPCILILSSVKSETLQDKIPSTVQGYPVIVRETGAFHALDP